MREEVVDQEVAARPLGQGSGDRRRRLKELKDGMTLCDACALGKCGSC